MTLFYDNTLSFGTFLIIAITQGCSTWTKIKCAYVVAKCASSCLDLDALDCINCVGDSYSTCKDCFKRQQQIEKQEVVGAKRQ